MMALEASQLRKISDINDIMLAAIAAANECDGDGDLGACYAGRNLWRVFTRSHSAPRTHQAVDQRRATMCAQIRESIHKYFGGAYGTFASYYLSS